MSAGELERVRGSERGEGCWLTLGQCRRGAVAFGSWLWRVHNAYCRATYHTNVCADAFTQRLALPPPLSRSLRSLFIAVLSFLSKTNIESSFFGNAAVSHKLVAFGKTNKRPHVKNNIDFF